MKTINYLMLIATVASLVSCMQEKSDPGMDLGALHLSESHPKPGDSLKIDYKSDSDITEAFYAYSSKGKIYLGDIDLKNNNGNWEGAIAIPDSATAIAFNFKAEEEFDTNNKAGFVTPLFDNNNVVLPGAKAGMATYKIYYTGRTGIEINNDSLIADFNAEFEKQPELKKDYFNPYTQILFQTREEDGKKFVNECIAELSQKSELSADDLQYLASLYNRLRDGKSVDSIRKIALEKYPMSNLAEIAVYGSFSKESDELKRKEIAESFIARFPKSIYIDYMMSSLASRSLKNDNKEDFLKYANRINGRSVKANLFNSTAWPLAEKGMDLDFAAELSKASLELLNEEKNSTEFNRSYYTASQYKNNIESTYGMYADTYGMILFKQGNIEEAIKYQEIAADKSPSPEVNNRLIQFLIATEKYGEAQEKAAKYISENTATPETREYLKQAFAKNNNEGKDLESYLAELEKAGHEKMLEEVKKTMINEEASTFKLVNIEGGEVALEELKGKTVVLDFWATWCGPCKASFPGMQMAVNKYKDNPDVVFLFIDTMETGTDEARIKNTSSFIKSNNYTFTVLLDQLKEEGSREFKVASAYQVTGIPTKFIIGPDGKIKFKAVGYSGSAEQLVSELDMMIELAGS